MSYRMKDCDIVEYSTAGSIKIDGNPGGIGEVHVGLPLPGPQVAEPGHPLPPVCDWICDVCGEGNMQDDSVCTGKHHRDVVEGKRQYIPGLRNTFETALSTDSATRKTFPIASGCLDYFPAALAEVARLSKYGNDKHNPGEELHHARGKSTDHADCIVRHLIERGTMDPSGFSHTVMVAWRALALLQEELEAAGAPLARGAREG